MALIAFVGLRAYLGMVMGGRPAHIFFGIEDIVDALEAARAVSAEAALPLGVELLEVRWIGSGSTRTLRVVLDRIGGVSAETCAEFSRQLDFLWEARSSERRDFGLEVTSPGPSRVLKTGRDFGRVVGRWVEVACATESGVRTVTGRVGSSDEEAVQLTDVDGATDGRMDIPLRTIERAKVLFVIGNPKPKRTENRRSLRRAKRG